MNSHPITINIRILGFIITIALVAIATSSMALDRETALKLLQSSKYFPTYNVIDLPIGTNVNMDDLIQAARLVNQTMAKELDVGYGCSDRLKYLKIDAKGQRILGSKFIRYNISVTTSGEKNGAAINKQSYGYSQVYQLALYKETVLRITGIKTISPISAEVEFVSGAKEKDVLEAGRCVHPNIISKLEATESIGRAEFSLYDDGWRVESAFGRNANNKWIPWPPAIKF